MQMTVKDITSGASDKFLNVVIDPDKLLRMKVDSINRNLQELSKAIVENEERKEREYNIIAIPSGK